jgi:hypothetical protein
MDNSFQALVKALLGIPAPNAQLCVIEAVGFSSLAAKD